MSALLRSGAERLFPKIREKGAETWNPAPGLCKERDESKTRAKESGTAEDPGDEDLSSQPSPHSWPPFCSFRF